MAPTSLSLRARAWVEDWWQGRAGAAGAALDVALWPAEVAYSGVVGVRNRFFDRGLLASRKGPIPVLSVGNLGVGGTGKTPFAAWLAAWLVRRGHRPAVVMRGYGGDEVMVHRELNPSVPVFVAPRRIDGVTAAAEAGCTAAVVDDGFQHRRLRRDFDVVLVSAEAWSTRSRRLLPRGPWREPVRSAERADVVVVTRKSVGPEEALRVRDQLRQQLRHPVVSLCDIRPSGLADLLSSEAVDLDMLRETDILAVAALADPRPFFHHLTEIADSVEITAFPDHHPFTQTDVLHLIDRARGRPIVCTLKDAVKLRPWMPTGVSAYVLHQRVLPGPELAHALDLRLTSLLSGST